VKKRILTGTRTENKTRGFGNLGLFWFSHRKYGRKGERGCSATTIAGKASRDEKEATHGYESEERSREHRKMKKEASTGVGGCVSEVCFARACRELPHVRTEPG